MGRGPDRRPAPSRRGVLGGLVALPVVACAPQPDTGEGGGTASSTTTTGTGTTGTGTTGTGTTGTTGTTTVTSTVTELAWDPEAVPADRGLFPVAAMSGVPRSTAMRVATWVADALGVRLRIWQPGSRAGVVVIVVDEDAFPTLNGDLQVEVAGLAPGTEYFYGFFRVDGDAEVGRSTLGRFRTPPADGTLEPLTVALGACNGGGNDPWPAFQRLGEHAYDLLLHLGDMAYNDGAVTEDEFRTSWLEYLTGDGYHVAFAGAALVATWDDHEFDNNFNPENSDPALLEVARRVYFSLLPVEEGPGGALWTSYRWGDTAEVIVLDCRTERLPSTLLSGAEQYLSRDQMDWFLERLRMSPCRFRVVLNSVPITNMPAIWDLAATDRWEGYRAARDEVLAAIRDEDLRDVWFVSGDFHVCFVGRVEPDDVGLPSDTWEIAVTSGNRNPLGDFLEDGDQFLYGTGDARTALVTFDPSNATVTVRFFDPETGAEVWSAVLAQA